MGIWKGGEREEREGTEGRRGEKEGGEGKGKEGKGRERRAPPIFYCTPSSSFLEICLLANLRQNIAMDVLDI